MTHDDYLEQHHELVSKLLPELAMLLAKGEYEFAAALLQSSRSKIDTMWQRVVDKAQLTVNP